MKAVTRRYGKAVVEIHVSGCKDCGTLWSSGWHLEREVHIQIGKSEVLIPLSICEDCFKARKLEQERSVQINMFNT